MKQIVYILSLLFFLLSSCYEDTSNTEVEDINSIVIDFGNKNPNVNYSVYLLDTLKITPIIYKEGLPDARLTFEWYISGNGIVPFVIDSTMTLRAKITLEPQTLPYNLRLTVRDERGIEKYMIFNISIFSSFAEGLVVADTRDEQNSDLSLIIDRCFNSNIKKDAGRTYMNAYSDVNNEMIQGIVRGVNVSSQGENRALTAISDKTIVRGDYYNFVKNEKESGMNIFYIKPEKADATFICTEKQYNGEYMCVNGLIYYRPSQNGGRLYGFPLTPAGDMNYHINKICNLNSHLTLAVGFDDRKSKLLFFNGDKVYYAKEQTGNIAFDVNNLKDYDCLHIGQIDEYKTAILTKEKSSGKYYALILNKSRTLITNHSDKKVEFSNAIEIGAAKYFATNPIEKTIYYATDTKLYATPIENSNSKVQYEVQPGEKITNIMVWSNYAGQIDYEDLSPTSETGYKTFSSTLGRMMLVTVYNESTKEGKIVAIPIITIGIGGLEQNPKFHVEFKGFGRILYITKQEK